MITTLTGSNAFELRRARDQIIEKFIAEHGDMAVERFDCATVTDPKVVYDAVTNLPFLVERKLVILDDPGNNKALSEYLPDWLGDSSSIDVLLVEPNPDKRTSFYKFLKENTQLRSFDALKDWDMPKWVTAYAAEKGASLTSGAVQLLIRKVGADQMQLAREIEKLAIFKDKIDAPDVELLVEELPQNTVFDMLDALAAGDSKKALKLYDKLIAARVEPAEIFGMLGWQLHVLALIHAGGEDGLNPYVVRKNKPLASRLSGNQLREVVDLTVQTELDMKRGISTSPADALGLLLHRVGEILTK